ncbi:MAG: DUF4469 domain-containing protein [Hyphomicrobiales bacterium]
MKYTLQALRLNNQESYTAKPIEVKTMTYDQLIDIITKPGSILKDTETKAVIDSYWETIRNCLSEGKNYNDDNISIRLGFSGKFADRYERFNPEKHEITINIYPKQNIKSAINDIQPEFVSPDINLPLIRSVYDWSSDTEDSLITPNSGMDIKGEKLKIHNNTEGEGIFFIHQESFTEYQAEQIRINQPKTLTCRIPDLPLGNYKIEVRNTTRKGNLIRKSYNTQVFTVK